MMVLDNKYEIGQLVYCITDIDQTRRIVTSIKITPGSVLLYGITCGVNTSDFYDFELSPDENSVLKYGK